MTEPSEAAWEKLRALMGYGNQDNFWREWQGMRPLARFIQQVSDAAEEALSYTAGHKRRQQVLAPFILPEPVDPLVKAIVDVWGTAYSGTAHAEMLHEALASHGLKIVKDETQGEIDG